ncbi:hypothetical protein LEMLEM_LOCUS3072 [Lemmus lemmus]
MCENQNSIKGGYPKWRKRETQPLAKKAALRIEQNWRKPEEARTVSSTCTIYDLSTFSPDRTIFQAEYATNAVETGKSYLEM